MTTLRKRLYHLVEADVDGTSHEGHDSVDMFLMLLIVLNIAAVVLESVPELEHAYAAQFWYFELFSVIIFTLEYIVRISVCTINPLYAHPILGRLRYASTPMVVIDLFAILPFYLPMFFALDLRMLRMLRMLRFLRVLKFGRYSTSLRLIGRVLYAKRVDLMVTLSVVVLLIVLSSSVMYVFEHEAQPAEFTSIPKAMWWSVETLTTVGYGDVYPITLVGKMFAAMIALLGVGIFALPAGILASGFAEEMRKRARTSSQCCPHCGKELES